MARFTDGVGYISAPDLTFHFWLVFYADGDMKFSRGEPNVERTGHKMKMQAVLPKSLWKTPALSGVITLSDPGTPPIAIDVQAAQDALRRTLGVDIDLKVIEPDV